MVLWCPGLRLDAPSVEFPLEYRELDRYNTNELQHFTQEAARVYTKGGNSRLYTRTSLKPLLSSINIAWDIIDKRWAARRITVLDPGFANTRTVHVRTSSGEEHIYLSPWTHADPGCCTDNDSDWSSTEQSNGCGHFTEDESTGRKGGSKTRLYRKNQNQMKGKGHRYHQRKNLVSKAKNRFSSQGRDDSVDDYEPPRRRPRANKSFEHNSSSDSEPPRRRTQTNQNGVKGKAKHEGNMKLKSEPVPLRSDQRDRRRRSSDRSSRAAGHDRMCEINNAKAILLDDVRKKAYDEDKVVEDEFEECLEKQKSKRGKR